jgi:fermentation-respiration switch protein FrsA (DUF1100 family)
LRLVTIVGTGLLALGGMTVGWIKFQEHYGIFYPTTYPKARLKQLPQGIEYVEFPSRDGTRVTGLLREGNPDKPAVLFAHGNAGNMIARLPWFQNALPDGWTGMILDYRGYGQSEGTPSVSGLTKDVRAAAKFLLQQTNQDDLYYHGRSLGVPFAAYASQHVPAEGMILESGFPNAPAVAREIMPVPGIGYLLSVSLDTVEYLETAQNKHGPFKKLIVHGSEDRILPVELGRTLYEKAPKPKQWWLVDRAGHNDLMLVAGDSYAERIKGFLKEDP